MTSSRYSPSSGSTTRAVPPPTVPSGMPTTGMSCDASWRMRNVCAAGPVSGSPTASAAILPAALKYCSTCDRRGAERVGNVVEAVRGVVRRQQRRRIDLDVQQIPDRVGVLGAVQPANQRRPRVGALARRAVQPALEPGNERGPLAARRGCGASAGGIMATRSLRTTASQISGSCPTCARSDALERQVAGPLGRVVAVEAVAADERLMRLRRLGLSPLHERVGARRTRDSERGANDGSDRSYPRSPACGSTAISRCADILTSVPRNRVTLASLRT